MATFKVKILTPEKNVLEADVLRLLVNTTSGDVCILAKHIPYVAPLDTGKLMVLTSEGKKYASVSGGFISVLKDETSVLTNFFEWQSDIDIKRAEKDLESALEKLSVETDKTHKLILQNKVAKAKNRIAVANL